MPRIKSSSGRSALESLVIVVSQTIVVIVPLFTVVITLLVRIEGRVSRLETRLDYTNGTLGRTPNPKGSSTDER